MQVPDIIDRIYEAALIPERWEGVLVSLSETVGTRGGMTFTHSEVGSSFIATPSAAEYSRRYFDEDFAKVNTRIERGRRFNIVGFATDLDIYEEHELANEPLYRDYLYPMGLGRFIGMMIETPDGDTIVVSFDTGIVDAGFLREKAAQLNTLRPHLARSLSLTARLRIAAAAKTAEGLGAFGIPACVANTRGRMLAANPLMQPLIPSVLMDRRESVVLRHRPSDHLLRKALKHVADSRGEAPVMSIPIPACGDYPASVVHVIPVRGNGRDLIPGGLCILAVSRLASSTLPGSALLRGLFDLTSAEANIARLIAGGTAPKDIGTSVGVSSNTVKAHLRSIYRKTGVDHYGALVRLLSGAPLSAGDTMQP